MPVRRPPNFPGFTSVGILALLLAGLSMVACPEPPTLIKRTQTDVFQQEIRKTVDILLVVDNSCSMIDEQIKLASNFDNFIEQFLTVDVNYQIGVVTTDMSDPEHQGRLVGETKLITSEMDVDSARETFSENVKVCATGSGFERGLAAAEAALSESFLAEGGPNAGLLRDDAALSIVFVSDEDDGSALPVGEYLTFFKGLKGDQGYRDDTLINLSAVVGEPPDGCEQPEPVIPNCADGLPDDEDGNIDCDAPICGAHWWCSVVDFKESDCSDGSDNDNDGLVDCADADCGSLDSCREISCIDGVDNDNDGLVDCADIDCLVGAPGVCGELSCSDGELVHVGNTFPNFLLDCADPSCFANPEYEELCLSERTEIDYADRCEETVVFDINTGGVLQTDGPDVDSTADLEQELAGCADPDCASYYLCSGALQVEGHDQCWDCIDNDGDGLEDCEDTDCLDSPFCDNPYEIEPGLRYIDVAQRRGGIVTSICAQEFSGLVRELGLNISGLRTIFYLTAWPEIATIEVFVDSQDEEHRLDEGWTYDPIENRMLFTEEAVPGEDSTLFVTYTRSNTPPEQQEGLVGADSSDDEGGDEEDAE
ncbi:MAG: hypothetical protein VX498_05630 [Myxococcota bacterium]|nr:hypothetical protein [Myxococcota bacterium]